MKALITAADLERVPQNGELAITDDTLITPLAREEAERRGITFCIASARDKETSPTSASAESSAEKSTRVVAIGADHGGYELKQQLKSHLRDWGYQVLDLGTNSADPVDYPDFAEAVGKRSRAGKHGSESCSTAQASAARLPPTRCPECARRYAMIARQRATAASTMTRMCWRWAPS